MEFKRCRFNANIGGNVAGGKIVKIERYRVRVDLWFIWVTRDNECAG